MEASPGSRDGAELLDRLRSLRLPRGDYAVFGSGPLVVRGIIPASGDLDVLARGAAWSRARELGPLVALPQYGVEIVELCGGGITVGTRWGIGTFDADALIDGAELIGGLPFVRLEHVRRYKQIAQRPKDLAHVAALDAWERAHPG